MYYFVSDWHFNHKNIIDYCERPFDTVEEMNEAIIERHNARVTDNDTVFCLGDILFGNKAHAASCISRLNGIKILIRGNHDRLSLEFLREQCGFKEVHSQYILTALPRPILMCHDPVNTLYWSKSIAGSIPPLLLNGHIHNIAEYSSCDSTKKISINVSVDVTDFYPVTYEELLKREERYKIRCFTE